MSQRSRLLSIASAAAVLSVLPAHSPVAAAAAALSAHIMITPDQVEWGGCSAALPPGARCAVLEGDLKASGALFGYRVEFPDGYRIQPHYHPADEHLVIVAGTFNMGMGERFDRASTRPLPAGSFAVMPRGAPHFAWTSGQTVVHVYATGPWGMTYVDPADDPRNEPNAGR
jgi:quercetin dioxygenase-like cupin family protein